MITVILVVHIMIAAALIVVVLMQRSEGGALGMGGGGGGGGGFLTGRGTANLLTRTTAVLAMCFFATSIVLTLLANSGGPRGSVFDNAGQPAATDTKAGTEKSAPSAPTDGGGGGLLDDLERGRAPLPSVPGTR